MVEESHDGFVSVEATRFPQTEQRLALFLHTVSHVSNRPKLVVRLHTLNSLSFD